MNMPIRTSSVAVLASALLGHGAQAAVCDYKPSRVGAMAASAISSAAKTGAEAAVDSVGYYTLVHPASGLELLGTASAGASAAGKLGLIGAAEGVAGTLGAIAASPVTLTVGAVVGAGAAVYEGACYFKVERITEPSSVVAILHSVAVHDETVEIIGSREGPAMEITGKDGPKTYLIENLYIADGRLKHRDRFLNTDLGPVIFVVPENDGTTD